VSRSSVSWTVLAICKNVFLHVPRVPGEKVHFCMFQGLLQRKFRVLVHPARLGTKEADLRGISKTNLPFLVNRSSLEQKQNYKFAFRKLTKRQVEALQTCLPVLLLTPQSGLCHIV